MEQKVKGFTQIKEKLFLKTISLILLCQRKWAAWMGLRFNSLSRVYRFICIGIFFLAFAFASALSILRSFVPVHNKQMLHKSPMIVNPHFEKNEPSGAFDTMISDKVQMFQRYLDSLDRTESGRLEKERFLKNHPGLIDSINQVKELFSIPSYPLS